MVDAECFMIEEGKYEFVLFKPPFINVTMVKGQSTAERQSV